MWNHSSSSTEVVITGAQCEQRGEANCEGGLDPDICVEDAARRRSSEFCFFDSGASPGSRGTSRLVNRVGDPIIASSLTSENISTSDHVFLQCCGFLWTTGMVCAGLRMCAWMAGEFILGLIIVTLDFE